MDNIEALEAEAAESGTEEVLEDAIRSFCNIPANCRKIRLMYEIGVESASVEKDTLVFAEEEFA